MSRQLTWQWTAGIHGAQVRKVQTFKLDSCMAAREGNSHLLAVVPGHQRRAMWPCSLVHIPCQAMTAPAAPAPAASSCNTLCLLNTRCSITIRQLPEVHMFLPVSRARAR